MFRYSFMDLSIAITRTGIFIAVYSIVLGIPFAIAFGLRDFLVGLIGSNWWMVPLISSTLLATGGPFIYLFIQSKAEDRLLQEQRRYQSTLRQASLGMGRIKDLRRLLTLIVHIVTRAVRIEHCLIYLFHETSDRFVLKASKGKMVSSGEQSILKSDSPLIQYLKKNKDPLVYEEIKQRSQDYQDKDLIALEAVMRNLNAELAVPSFIEQRLIALVILGKKKSGKLYSQDDLAVFSILMRQMGLSIQNIQLQEEVVQKEKFKAVATFASGIVHEVKNPLTAIKTFFEFYHERQNDPVFIKDFLRVVPKEVERMERLMQNLLAFAKPSSVVLEKGNLHELIGEVLCLLKGRCEKNNVAIEKELDPRGILCAFDANQLKQAFLNILSNAIEAMPSSGRVLVSTQRGVRRCRVRIKDTGPGIAGEHMEQIFDPFFSQKNGGTGLGLSITREIIDNHGGKIWVESETGQGAEFVVELPLI